MSSQWKFGINHRPRHTGDRSWCTWGHTPSS